MRRIHPNQPTAAAGVTLVEVLVVVLIVGIMAVIAVPLTLRQLVRLRIEGFADQATSLLQATRGRAIRDNEDYSVAWADLDGDTVLDAMTGVSGLGAATTEAATLSLAERGLTVYTDVPCLAATTDGNTHDPAPVTFDSRGVADQLTAFCFEDPNGNVLQVAIDTPGGPPKVRKLLASNQFSPETWQWEWY